MKIDFGIDTEQLNKYQNLYNISNFGKFYSEIYSGDLVIEGMNIPNDYDLREAFTKSLMRKDYTATDYLLIKRFDIKDATNIIIQNDDPDYFTQLFTKRYSNYIDTLSIMMVLLRRQEGIKREKQYRLSVKRYLILVRLRKRYPSYQCVLNLNHRTLKSLTQSTF